MDRLMELIQKKGISQYKLANDINAPKTTVNNWIKGRAKCPGDHYLKILANYLGVSTAYLKFGEKTEETITKEKLTEEEINWLKICQRTKELLPEKLELLENLLRTFGVILPKEKLLIKKTM